jgi:LPXTG-motif cell wall-anchored protein
MHLTLLSEVLGIISGGLVGLILGLVGGGGSILAVPLLVYVVGVASPHVAIGTAAIAVAASALANLGSHARLGTVKWPCAAVFASAGVAGALAGSTLAKTVDGQKLLLLFGFLMIAVGIVMFRRRGEAGNPDVRLTRANASAMLPALAGIGFVVGGFSGFFGIGGGFLIVPGLMWATGMTLRSAIGTSLVAVTAFGAATAGNYALSGLVDWPLAGLFVAGGLAGGFAGVAIGKRLAERRQALGTVFAGVVIVVGLYVVARGVMTLAAGA